MIEMRIRARVAPVLIATIAVVALFALLIGGCAVRGYNRAISLAEQVDQRWAQVDVVLQRRYDLVPNLVESVKGYATHEREIFTDIAHAREKYFQAGNRNEKVEAANGMERALSRLLVLQERYPELRAQASFQDLMTQLEGTENRIAVERHRYTQAVRELNTFVRGFPGRIYAGWAGVKAAEQFEAAGEQVRQAPHVDFGTTRPAP
jgi:LemA protein